MTQIKSSLSNIALIDVDFYQSPNENNDFIFNSLNLIGSNKDYCGIENNNYNFTANVSNKNQINQKKNIISVLLSIKKKKIQKKKLENKHRLCDKSIFDNEFNSNYKYRILKLTNFNNNSQNKSKNKSNLNLFLNTIYKDHQSDYLKFKSDTFDKSLYPKDHFLNIDNNDNLTGALLYFLKISKENEHDFISKKSNYGT